MSYCNNKNVYHVDMVDAWQLSREYSCNESPKCISNFSDVEVGDLVEVNDNIERFWVEIIELCNCFYIGRVRAPLYKTHTFNVGDLIHIDIQDIYNLVER